MWIGGNAILLSELIITSAVLGEREECLLSKCREYFQTFWLLLMQTLSNFLTYKKNMWERLKCPLGHSIKPLYKVLPCISEIVQTLDEKHLGCCHVVSTLIIILKK